MEAENKGVIRRVFEELFNKRRLDLIPELYCEDCEGMDPANPSCIRGHKALADLLTLHTHTFPDHRYTVHQVIAEGDCVCVRWSVVGLGQKVAADRAIEGLSLCEFSRGKIRKVWQHWDNLGLMQALGTIQSDIKVEDTLQGL